MILFIAPRFYLAPLPTDLECATHQTLRCKHVPCTRVPSLTSHNGCAVTKAYRQISVNLLFTFRGLLVWTLAFAIQFCGRLLVFVLHCCPLKISDRLMS